MQMPNTAPSDSNTSVSSEANMPSTPAIPATPEPTTPNPSTPEVLTPEEFEAHQEAQGQQLVQTIGITQPEKTTEVIASFVQSYEQHKTAMPLDQWLVVEFKKYPNIWRDEAEVQQSASEVIDTVTQANQAKVSLYAHVDSGRSEASWIAQQMETSAKTHGVLDVGQYAGRIETTLEQANADMARTVLTKDGNISQALNLDGFLAEQHHVDSFNLDAAAKGSELRAKVLSPEGAPYGKNSMDIGIYDANGKLVRRYQAKYGSDADATQNLWDKGDYRGQRKLVPSDQLDQLDNATDKLSHEGVESKPLSKQEAKALQEKAQRHEEIKNYEWNDVSRIEISKRIGKQALVGAAIVAGMHGVRIMGRRLWNSLTNQPNQSLSEDLNEFFVSSVKSGASTGVQVAVSGGVVVAVKSGWLGAALKNTPVGQIAAMAYVGLENIKVLFKLGKGDINGPEALDAMGKVTTSLTASLALGAWGMATAGVWAGAMFGPLGMVVGSLVGGIAAGMAGSTIGNLAYEGGKKILSTASSVVKAGVGAIVSGAHKLGRVLNPFNWF